MQIRWMIKKDMRDVLEIERASFNQPWNEEQFTEFLRQPNAVCMVAETWNEVIGYMAYTIHKDRLAVENFAVDPEFRRETVGSRMVHRLKEKAEYQSRSRISLCVRERNLPAQKFWSSNGFKATGVIRDYYQDIDGVEDAYRFACEVFTSPSDVTHNRRKEPKC